MHWDGAGLMDTALTSVQSKSRLGPHSDNSVSPCKFLVPPAQPKWHCCSERAGLSLVKRGPFNRCLQLLPPLLQLPSYLLKTGQPHALALYYLLPLQCNFLDFFRFLSGCMACSSRSQVIFLAICSLLLSQLQSGCQRDEQSLYHLWHIFLPKFNF
uniref:Uncharacterized protein n=1 Tax=Rousettus aegyptiacus TaxID=9407 RepID=A0A7J8CI46_ROUAE|nr:hypothetical protein HJG63_009058 [Rousettus aegyptiacus]